MKHEPFAIEVPDARVCVLMVHGILGSPHHFDMLLPYIPADWSVCSILLDGHGGTARDFARSSRQKWEKQVCDEVARICAGYDQVVIVAHSMGCMLSANAVVEQGLEHKIATMLFLGAAMYPKCDPPIVATSFAMVFGNPTHDSARTAAARVRCGTVLHKRLWEYFAWVPRFFDLFAISRYTRKRIPGYDLPMIVLQSYKDEVVGRRSIRPLLKNPHVKGEFLMHSSHFYYPHEDEKHICKVFSGIVADVSKKVQKVQLSD